MLNLWDVITGNSSLPVQAGSTFWDHMQNQEVGTDGGAQGGGGVTIGGTVNVFEIASIEVQVDTIGTVIVLEEE